MRNMVMATKKPKYFIRSKYADGHLLLEAVHAETDIVFHNYQIIAENEQDANFTIEAYKRFMSKNDNALRFMALHLADILEVDYKGKSANEVAFLIVAKIKESDIRGEQ